MAGTTVWYVRSGGADSNSGGTDSDTPVVDGETGTPGTVVNAAKTLTDAGATFQTDGVTTADAVNINVGGTRTIYEIASVDSETQITLATAPSNGDYAYSIGGARASVKKTGLTGAGNNAVLASSDVLVLEAGATFTETSYVPATTNLHIRSNTAGTKAFIDGTGGGAGTDVLSYSGTIILTDIGVLNGVDMGFQASGNSSVYMTRCSAISNGGTGWTTGANAGARDYADYCVFRGNTGVNFAHSGSANSLISRCEFSEGTTHGCSGAPDNLVQMSGCLIFDNGGRGVTWTVTGDLTQHLRFNENTIEGNTSHGWEMLGSFNYFGLGTSILNNIFSNNGGYGVTFAQAPVAQGYVVDYNDYYGNTTAPRSNIATGTNDVTTDPAYTAAASDDYSIKSTGGAYKAGYSPFKNPTLNALNIGAVPGPGSAEVYIYSTRQTGGGLGPGVPD